MRVLMLCTKYPLDPNDQYMTTELAAALVAARHHVQVVAIEWSAQLGRETLSTRSADGVDILVVAPRGIARMGRLIANLSKWLFSSIVAERVMRRALTDRFDVLICFTPCVTVWAQLLWSMRRWRPHSILFVHDFFPFHHRAIGLVPGGLIFQAARWLEQSLIRKFDVIGCNWPSNIGYLRKRYSVRAEQETLWTPLWSDIAQASPPSKEGVRARYGLPHRAKILVFGGQLTEGRGVVEMLASAAIARQRRPDIVFLFVGEGRLVPLVERHIASGGDNVILIRRVPRDEYLTLLSACDVGLVATVAGVDSSSFPTKTIDYLRASLPIVAAVEEQSDYREFLERWNIGFSTPAGDADALFDAIVRAVENAEIMDVGRLANACLKQVFDVKNVVEMIESKLGNGRPKLSPDFGQTTGPTN